MYANSAFAVELYHHVIYVEQSVIVSACTMNSFKVRLFSILSERENAEEVDKMVCLSE